MRTLSLTTRNIVEGTNNSQLTFQFPAGAITLHEGDQLALSSVSMYNSVFNITAALNNNSFKYTWVDGSVKTVTITDGFYDVDALNDYLHQQMLNNGHYLIDNATGNFLWFLTIQVNVTIYAVQIQAYPMNATTYPIGASGATYKLPTFTGSMVAWVVPTANITPYIEIQANNLRTNLGFTAGFYPGTTVSSVITLTENTITVTGANVPPAQSQITTYTAITTLTSQSTPQITSLTSFLMTCTLINNNYTIPNTLIAAFPPASAFAEQFIFAPNQMSFIDCQPGTYGSFSVQFFDQNLRQIAMQDNQIVVLLVLRSKSDRA
jgi:hypothetical protein